MKLTFCAQSSLNCVSMRIVVLAGLVMALCSGCKTAEKNQSAGEPKRSRRVTATTNAAPNERFSIRPLQAVTGRIIAVREPLRFVVIDFGTGKMPQLEQRLSAYRLDQKVAELKVSGPYLGTTVAADITGGEAREGDLVRE